MSQNIDPSGLWSDIRKFVLCIQFKYDIKKQNAGGLNAGGLKLDFYLWDWLSSHGGVTSTWLMTGTVERWVKLTPSSVVKNIPLTLRIGQIVGF